jgi:hypothetical protein
VKATKTDLIQSAKCDIGMQRQCWRPDRAPGLSATFADWVHVQPALDFPRLSCEVLCRTCMDATTPRGHFNKNNLFGVVLGRSCNSLIFATMRFL